MDRWLVLVFSFLLGCRPAPPPATPDAGPPPGEQHLALEMAAANLGTGTLMVRIDTDHGVMIGRLFEQEAPRTVANFVGLARGLRLFQDARSGEWVKRPFYDGLSFHRAIADFLIQGGDPLGNGTGGPGYFIADEHDGPVRHDLPGVLSMVNAGPDTGGSQFVVLLRPAPQLDGRHAVFGVLTEGLGVARRIAAERTGAGERLEQPAVIKQVTIFRQPS